MQFVTMINFYTKVHITNYNTHVLMLYTLRFYLFICFIFFFFPQLKFCKIFKRKSTITHLFGEFHEFRHTEFQLHYMLLGKNE